VVSTWLSRQTTESQYPETQEQRKKTEKAATLHAAVWRVFSLFRAVPKASGQKMETLKKKKKKRNNNKKP
jgi:hypothetical protein